MIDDFKWWKKEEGRWGTMTLFDGRPEENQEHDFDILLTVNLIIFILILTNLMH